MRPVLLVLRLHPPPPPFHHHLQPKYHNLLSSSLPSSPIRPHYTSTSLPQLPLHRTRLQQLEAQQVKLAQPQIREHSHHHGHGHSHSHGPNPLLLSKDRTDPGVRITRIGLYVNLGMVISKGIGGFVFNSQALTADAFHALTDMVSDIMTLLTVTFALRPPTHRFPNGYGKLESLGSLSVSSLLLLGGLAMGYTSLLDLLPHELSHILPSVHSHSHGHGHGHGDHVIPGLGAAVLAAGSIGIKEWLYRATMKVAKAKGSGVLASNAVHHRVDSLTAIVATVAIAGANVWPAAGWWMDPVGGLLVAAMVVRAGGGNTWAALEELADAGVSSEVSEKVRRVVKAELAPSEQATVRDVEGVKSGQNYLLSVTLEVQPGRTVAECEALEGAVRECIGRDVPGAWRVGVKFVTRGGCELGRERGREFVKMNKDGVVEVDFNDPSVNANDATKNKKKEI